MAEVAFAGDWHGNAPWGKLVLERLGERGITKLYHVGDFGLWPNGYGYMHTINRAAEENGVEIWVTPGNHEDWSVLTEAFKRNPNEAVALTKMTSNIKWCPPGLRWEDQGVSFVSLGGAASIDRSWRKEGKTWWPEEFISLHDVARTVAGGYADIMLTHDAPLPGIRAVQEIANTPGNWRNDDLLYAHQGREVLTRAWDAVKPRFTVHGHFHVYGFELGEYDGRELNICSLAKECDRGNVVTLDLEYVIGEMVPLALKVYK